MGLARRPRGGVPDGRRDLGARAAPGPTALDPAADVVVGLVLDWLPRAGRPVRDGTHASTAFALGLLLDAAGPLGRDDLADAVRAYVRDVVRARPRRAAALGAVRPGLPVPGAVRGRPRPPGSRTGGVRPVAGGLLAGAGATASRATCSSRSQVPRPQRRPARAPRRAQPVAAAALARLAAALPDGDARRRVLHDGGGRAPSRPAWRRFGRGRLPEHALAGDVRGAGARRGAAAPARATAEGVQEKRRSTAG